MTAARTSDLQSPRPVASRQRPYADHEDLTTMSAASDAIVKVAGVPG